MVRNKKPAHTELREITAALIDHAEHSLTLSGDEAGEAVHEIRKSMKKLRTLLRLTRSALNRDTYLACDRAIHDFSSSLSSARDSTILISSLRGLTDYFQPWVDTSLAEPALQYLQDLHTSEMRSYLAQRDQHTFEKSLNKLRKQLADWTFAKVTEKTVHNGLEIIYRHGRKTWKTASDEPTTENIHALRKQVKYLWYSLRLLRQRTSSTTAGCIERLEELAELLGQEHDLALLAQTLTGTVELCADIRQANLITALANEHRRILFDTAIPVADTIYAMKWKQSPFKAI
jgi:CHAD domain-containing protein